MRAVQSIKKYIINRPYTGINLYNKYRRFNPP
jgi:hypothetical protein